MKRILISVTLLISVFFISGCGATNTMSINKYLGGYWGQWQNVNSHWGYYGNPGSFVVYDSGYLRDGHPSNFCYRITINGFNKDSIPKEEWRNFSGYVEYHTYTQTYNYKESSRYFVEYNIRSLSKGGEFIVKRPAQIKVFKKRNGSYTYNAFFDDVGFGVTIPWQHAHD